MPHTLASRRTPAWLRLAIVATLVLSSGCTDAPKPRMAATSASSSEVATTVASQTSAAASSSAARAAPPGWIPVWIEDFDGPAGSAPDATKWGYDLGGQGWGNAELQNYTDRPSNVALDGAGNLVITAREENFEYCWYGDCTHTSGRLLTQSKFTQKYGRIEARLRVPVGRGLWPAFWMLGDNLPEAGWPGAGEIDIMEILGHGTNKTYGTLHGPGYSGADGVGANYTLPNNESFAAAFHIFTVEWAPNEINWYVDGNLFSTKTPADVGGNTWVFDHPFFIIVNLAVGGNWPGSPDSETKFPAEYVIDYIRTYQPASS